LIKPLEEDSRTEVKMLIDQLCKNVFEELASQGVPDDAISWRPVLQLRYEGTDTTIPVAFSDFDFAAARAEFETAHKAQFGFVYDNKTVIIEAISVEAIDDREDHRIEPEHPLTETRSRTAPPVRSIPVAGGTTPASSAAKACNPATASRARR
jgi:5-oxoprolinase (ATP-hydrolysing)